MNTLLRSLFILMTCCSLISCAVVGQTAQDELAQITHSSKPIVSIEKASENTQAAVLKKAKTPVYGQRKCDLEMQFDLIINGLDVQLVNQSKGTYTNVEWTMGDGTILNENTVNHQYDQPGIYYFTATIYDNKTGCVDFVGGNFFVKKEEKAKTTAAKGKHFTHKDMEMASVLNLK